MVKVTTDTGTIVRVLTVVALFVAGAFLIKSLITPLLWLGAAFFIAVVLDPVASWLQRRLPNQSRSGSVLLILLGFVLVLGFLVYSLVPPVIDQTQAFVKNLPHMAESLSTAPGPIGDYVREHGLRQSLGKLGSNASNSLLQPAGSVVDFLRKTLDTAVAAVTIFVLALFMLLEAPYWKKLFETYVPGASEPDNKDVIVRMHQAVSGYVAGNALTSLIAAVCSAIVLTILGVSDALSLAVIVGILDFIPLVGATVAGVIIVTAALFHSISAGLITAIFFAVYQQLENHVLQPIVYGQSTKLTPLTVLVAIILGSTLAGLLGALAAIPVAACIKVLLEHHIGRHHRLTARGQA